MARLDRSVPGNAPGDLFIDDGCIACDTCRRLAPEVFGGYEDEAAFVRRQPADDVARLSALQALVSCPVAAIGSRSGDGVKEAARTLPRPVPGLADVLDCGYASKSSFGAASWLVLREGGNVLVDSPRFTKPLLERIEALGGARTIFLTHRDDVADHAQWAESLGAKRVLHRRDVTAWTREVELQPDGDDPVALADDLLVIPVPGHTEGSAALLFRDEVLFTGDHLWGDARGRLGASRSVCWHDWAEQLGSLERLLDHRFSWVLPGHVRPFRAESPAAAQAALRALLSANGGMGSRPSI